MSLKLNQVKCVKILSYLCELIPMLASNCVCFLCVVWEHPCLHAHPSPLPGLCQARCAFSKCSARGAVRTLLPALLSLCYLIYFNLYGILANKSTAQY